MSRARDLADGTFSGAFSADSPTLVVDDVNNRVGVGDTAPSEKLNVDGNIMLEGGDQYMYLSNVGTGNSGIYVRGNTAGSYLRSHTTGIFTWEVTGSEKMRIDSNGNLGIGITSPATSISGSAQGLTTQHSNVAFMSLDNTGTSGRRYTLYSNTTGKLVFYDEDANLTRMQIDSNGYVTTPNQPSFSAHFNGNYTRAGNDTKLDPNWIAIHNTGGGFTSSNSRFTAPIAGKYLLAFCVTHAFTGTSVTGDAWTVIPYINGSIYGGSNYQGYYGDGGLESGVEGVHSWTGVVDLDANDYVELYTSGTTATTITFLNGSTFHMHLLG